MPETPEKTNYRKPSDIAKIATSALLAYTPFLSLLYLGLGPVETIKHMAIIGGIFSALRIPYLREVPMALSKLVVRGLMIRKAKPAPQHLVDMVNELSAKAGMKAPKVYTFHGGMTDNAAAMTDQIYVGDELMQKVNDDELRFILAHELSHVKTKDMSDIYLGWPPYINSIIMGITAVGNAVFSFSLPALAAGAFGASQYLYQKTLFRFSTRTIEYRADRNAMQLTGDLKSAVSAFSKITAATFLKEPSTWENLQSSHPVGVKRLQGLCKAFNEASGANSRIECTTIPDSIPISADSLKLKTVFIDAESVRTAEKSVTPEELIGLISKAGRNRQFLQVHEGLPNSAAPAAI